MALEGTMFDLDENHYFRKCFLKQEQVPTRTVMKKKMQALADVYFKMMTPKLKVLAGLLPPMKGGGQDWYMPPQELLEGRAVLKPVKKGHLQKLGFDGISNYGALLIAAHRKSYDDEKEQALLQNDINWKKLIECATKKEWEERANEAAEANTQKILKAFEQFQVIYRTSLNNMEQLIMDSASKEIERVREEAYAKMKEKYRTMLKQQATTLYDKWEKRLKDAQERLKQNFITNVENAHVNMIEKVHDIKLNKRVVVEKLRHILECQNRACQVYVALKEKEECQKEQAEMKRKHRKKMKQLKEEVQWKEFELKIAVEKEKKRQLFNQIWRKKICHVVKKFQEFVLYALRTFPEHAEFFLNMEKLMMLQLNDALEDPKAPSIFISEKAEPEPPKQQEKPWVLVRDLHSMPEIKEDLLPKPTSSQSHSSLMPVVVINNRCIYAACDNFECFTSKIKDYLYRNLSADDVVDDHDYDLSIPAKYKPSQELLELQLESSLMRIIQSEAENIDKVTVTCCDCALPYCFCSPGNRQVIHMEDVEPETKSVESPSSGVKIGKSLELIHEREPKWESYMNFVKPKCACPATAKKHLNEHLPVYMRKMSKYAAPEIPNYEPTTVASLRRLVKRAKGKQTPPATPQVVEEPKVRDVAVQCDDVEYDNLCECFAETQLKSICLELFEASKTEIAELALQTHCEVVGRRSQDYLAQDVSHFTRDRACSLKTIIEKEPELKQIFQKSNCKGYDD